MPLSSLWRYPRRRPCRERRQGLGQCSEQAAQVNGPDTTDVNTQMYGESVSLLTVDR